MKKRATNLKTEIKLKQVTVGVLQQQLKTVQPPLRLIQSDVMKGLFENIVQLILSSDLSLDSFYPRADRKHGFYTERSFYLDVTGNLDQLLTLINKIQAIDSLLSCDDFKILKSRSDDKVQMQLTIKVFFENRIKQKKHNSYNKINQMNTIKLEHFSLDSLSFIGLIRQQNKVFALISTPDLSISLVKAGDYIGNHRGKILLVQDKRIYVREDIFVGRDSSKITTLHLHENLK